MGKTVSKRNRGRSSSSSKTPFISQQRKREILGLILMVFSLLITLAVLTYSIVDEPLARRFSFDSIFVPGTERAANALGPTGAAIAHLLVPNFIGYFSLLLPFSMFGWGYVWLRNRPKEYLPLVSGLMGVVALLLASLVGWLSITFESNLLAWSGSWGLGLSGWMHQLLGGLGSVVILLLVVSITALLLIDHDIQRSLDRIEAGFERFRVTANRWWAGRESRKAARSSNKNMLREEKKPFQVRDPDPERLTTIRSKEAKETAPTPFIARPEEESNDPIGMPDPTDLLEESISTADVEMHVHEQIKEELTNDLHRETTAQAIEYPFNLPDLDLLDEGEGRAHQIDYDELDEHKQILLDKLETYNIEITSIEAIVGPTVTLYELTPAPGIKISRITALENDLAMAMAARGIRMIAPIPGKTSIGVEIPNRHRELVRIRDIIGTTRFSDSGMELPLILGKSIEGETILEDLTRMPHLLIAGSTGSGKSVGLNTFIAGLLYACPPSMLKFVMIDPKKIELSAYANIASHYMAMPPEASDVIITDVDQALGTLRSCEKEMERRYDLLSEAQVRSLKEYNQAIDQNPDSGGERKEKIPYIVIIVDELADLMMTAGKDIEAPIARLAQMARAVGIHLILATQRPSVDVITGLIKANFPSRIAYQVASKIDSRTIMDHNGAEGLVGNGDMLYMSGSRITRLQGPFVSIDEIDRITTFIGQQQGPGPYMLPSVDLAETSTSTLGRGSGERDELFSEAAYIIVRSQQGSVSLLQRKLAVGYARAARLIDQLEDAGIVGPFEGSKARQVLVDDELQLDQILSESS
ncbi:MAG: DNA translocase FtsK [Bacteroidetes bacterium]|nr:MAG: DNA translocase FtsK [Bacteroidota bacterium]